MVASGVANLFTSVSSGVNALWGPLHGGANQAVLEMLDEIHAAGDDGTKFIQAAKDGKGARLMGFGHRVYKNHDPRARIIKGSFDKALASLGAVGFLNLWLTAFVLAGCVEALPTSRVRVRVKG